ncbi:Roundabout-like protein 1 [Frankliniella fusca]|uniref:Roundabout-like protein 1 n=1 Tax=Frankliniella fusca TaxID=407009 RepID=A0AAE1LU09_9NEOP|nr:Roundabout-like protein 1 [Frankliniella fusca]
MGMGTGGRAPRITEHPQSMVVPRHDPVTLKCGVEGLAEGQVEWWKDGAPIRTHGHSPAPHRILLSDGSLFLLSASQRSKDRRDSDAGVYWCVARNAYGEAVSRNATLEVAVLRDTFSVEPRSMRVAQGDDALLECGPPKGQPEPTISWTKDGETLDLDGSKR